MIPGIDLNMIWSWIKIAILWINERPSHLAVAGAALLVLPYFWKLLFWYLVFPGSFALTYAGWRWFKKRRGE